MTVLPHDVEARTARVPPLKSPTVHGEEKDIDWFFVCLFFYSGTIMYLSKIILFLYIYFLQICNRINL